MRGTDTYFVRVAVGFGFSRHMFGQGKGDHARGDGGLDNGLEIILSVSGTELPGVTMH